MTKLPLKTTAKSAKRRFSLAVALLGAVALLAATGLTVLAGTKPGFTMKATPATQTVVAGQSTSYGIALTRDNKFTSPVALSIISGLPNQSTATFSPNPIPGSGNASTLTVTTGSGTTLGPHTLTIRGTAGTSSSTTTVTVNVAAPAQPNFEITANPNSRVMTEDDSVSHSISIARSGGFTGVVSLTATGMPKGMTTQFTPSTVPSASTNATLAIVTDNQVKPGTYGLTITGQSGSLTRSASLMVTVEEKKAFSITGDALDSVAPNKGVPLNLFLTNPHNFPLTVLEVSAGVAPRTSDTACGGNQNFTVAQIPAGRYPFTLGPRETKSLTAIGISDDDKPTLRMLNLDTNQDACKGVALELQYSGSATK
jgi:hypothetical protein